MSWPLGVLLAPGAGADRSQPALVAIDHAVSAAGATVVRMDFPYRMAGRRAPDRAPLLVASVVSAATELAARIGPSTAGQPVVLGGRSMGGRMCSMAVADGLPAAGLILISYPLHPPGRPDKMRDGHFPDLAVPGLFVSGTRDAFATRPELDAAVTAIPGPVTMEWLEGRDHSLRGCDATVTASVTAWMARTFPDRWRAGSTPSRMSPSARA